MIFSWKTKAKPADNYLGLTPDRLELLESLENNKAFAIFTQVLRDVAEFNGSVLLTTHDYGDMRERAGFVNALRHIVELLPTIKRLREESDEQRKRRHARENGDSRYFGGPWFDSIHRWSDRGADTNG